MADDVLFYSLFGVAGLFLTGLGLYYFRIYRAIAKTPTTPIGELRKGMRGVKGRVVHTKEKFKSPLTSSSCVYYRFVVTENRKPGSIKIGKTHHAILVDDIQLVNFSVKDKSGEVKIEADDARLLLDVDKRMNSGLLKSAPSKVENMLQQRYSQTSKLLSINRILTYEEKNLKVGEEIYVLGYVEGDVELKFVRRFGMPFIISDTSKDSLVEKFKRKAFLYWEVAGLLVIFSAYKLFV